MFWKIEVRDKPGIFDAVGEGIRKDISDLGINAVKEVRFIQVYMIEGSVFEDGIRRICEELLIDRVAQDYAIVFSSGRRRTDSGEFMVEVAYNPGVMDPVEESTLKAIRDMGINTVHSVKTARKFLIRGAITEAQLKTISEKLLYNKLIQHPVTSGVTDAAGRISVADALYNFQLLTIDLLRAGDTRLIEISRQGQLFLNSSEMHAIKAYFKKLKRNPTDCELETIAQTWSEHCGHKTFRGRIAYKETVREGRGSRGRAKTRSRSVKIDNLLKSTIMKATRELNKPWCVSVFHDNSGIIKFDDKYNVCFKVETHNHPSALEPFGGANTGVGGVIRDPLGTGLGAKPILNTDVFCFAPPDFPFGSLPPGTLHPKRVMKGVVSGVRDYGNKMGIPTVNGAVLFHDSFVGNPLVFCGTAGILPKDKCAKQAHTGEAIVVIGGRTGRDGIHGATFSSGELTHESEVVSSGAVQIGNPIQEKKMVDAILQARDRGLYTAITDCGAGGLSSAVGEMAAAMGCRVYLEKVPLKYKGLSYTEIWISESQERMVVSVPRENVPALLDTCRGESVEATVIGEFTDTGKLELFYKGNKVCSLDMDFLHDGLPKTEKKAVFIQPRHKEPAAAPAADLTKVLLKLLSRYDTCSKEWIVRQYDHEVQGGSVLKPLAGLANDGPSDAAIVKPLLGSDRGIIVANGINFRYGFIDPYWMAAGCIDEALRQIIAVGGSLKQVAILDNFCWGNPDKPDRLGSLVRAALGCYDAAKGFGVPFISGKDSLYNEYAVRGRSLAIPGTLLISALAVMEDVKKTVSMYAKQAGDLVYVVGMTRDELGGSAFYDLRKAVGNNVPAVNIRTAKAVFDALARASSLGLVRAMHDCSEGGIGVAAAEMAFAGGLGMDLFLKEVPAETERSDTILFSESHSRFIVEVAPKDQKAFERVCKGMPAGLAGCINESGQFRVFDCAGTPCVQAPVDGLKAAWQKPLQW
ncbi:MAG TPA: phosphoribosylformylglycinamidine synthase subunit PurL [Candidatus Omnitrophota bacterium]|nr:phosphoribosylformylglycinamidine synthase subunit PurL [Candidatus Omnitrophota bacterium]HNQ50426.1 phosphoribosylformylglycinamidine synthase subunit PurL [Candidatus Omnitrophota bacterium]HQO37430.1 phosphoribosylformylglycinamidine synthase subunit PurL [Candidatus Omnitrophota bacterium]HQQ05693.1 phosphoribosylformylglycinamidine synthase subunit PurL [Candidatus Omnitrophota bacterium]